MKSPCQRTLARVSCQVAVALFLVQAAQAQDSPGGDESPALLLESGVVARSQLVAIGRDLILLGEATRDVAVLGGSATVEGEAAGDVIVIGGSAKIGPTARIHGDLFVLGGEVEAASGAVLEGRVVAYPSVPANWLVLLEGPALGLSSWSPIVVAAKLALLAAWVLVALIFLGTGGPPLEETAVAVRSDPFRSFYIGLTVVLALVLSLVLLSAFVPPVMGVPLLVLVAVFALVLKLWGTVAVFLALGRWLLERLRRSRESALTAVLVGLLPLALFKMLPYVGVWVWTVATLIGVGASLGTKFGRREAWFPALDRPQAIS